MKKTIKFTAAVAMIGLLAFTSAGCGGDDKKAAAAKDTLKFGVTNFADSLEPTDNYFGWIVMRYGLGECLVKFDEKMNSTPWLAESWQVSDDKLTWTFKINDKAKFSNGNKVTAESVKKSIERTFEKAARARAMFEYDNISADGQTLTIKTHTPLTTAASTKSRFFIFNTILRAKRAYLVQVTIVKAIIALIRLPPRIPAIAMASIIPGKEIIISEIRIITVSTFPPK